MRNDLPAAGHLAAGMGKQERWTRNRHKSALVWITGLSASGKTTIAAELQERLFHGGARALVLDGDSVRKGLNRDLGYSQDDRKENLRRVGEVARLAVDAGIITIAAFISPYESDRLEVRRLFDKGEFIEAYLKCDLSVCELRDPKGLYESARRGTSLNLPAYLPPMKYLKILRSLSKPGGLG